jgi:hypothetical protein
MRLGFAILGTGTYYEQVMAKLIGSPTRVPSPGVKARLVDEYVGLVNTGDGAISITYMRCAPGWEEPAQCPRFDEFIIVLKGTVLAEDANGVIEAAAVQAIHVIRDEWIRYSASETDGAEYIAVCTPAFSRAAIRWEE